MDVSSVSPWSEPKIVSIVSFTASITLINTQLIHQFVFRREESINSASEYNWSRE